MTTVAALYNTLPSIEEADRRFINRGEIFSKLTPIIAPYADKFGVCLVHRHCALEEGEMMVSTGNISQPERNVQCYPERWLPTGEAFEFSREFSSAPPQELFTEFRNLVRDIGVLGIFVVQEEDRKGELIMEHTEGRQNIVTRGGTRSGSSGITTSWTLGKTGWIKCWQCRNHPC
jgi:hypothetical protein